MENDANEKIESDTCFDLYTHMKVNIKCSSPNCEIHDSDFTHYCFTCRRPVCEICKTSFHSSHPVQRKCLINFNIESLDQIFKDLEANLNSTRILIDPDGYKKELREKIMSEFEEIETLIQGLKRRKIQEIETIFNEAKSCKNLSKLVKDSKKVVVEYFTKFKDTYYDFDIKDEDNAIYLQNYDVFNMGIQASEQYNSIIKNIKDYYDNYERGTGFKYQGIKSEIEKSLEEERKNEIMFNNLIMFDINNNNSIGFQENIFLSKLDSSGNNNFCSANKNNSDAITGSSPQKDNKDKDNSNNTSKLTPLSKDIFRKQVASNFERLNEDLFKDLRDRVSKTSDFLEAFKKTTYDSFKKHGSLIDIEKTVKMFDEKTNKRTNFIKGKAKLNFSPSQAKAYSTAGVMPSGTINRSKNSLKIGVPVKRESRKSSQYSPSSTPGVGINTITPQSYSQQKNSSNNDVFASNTNNNNNSLVTPTKQQPSQSSGQPTSNSANPKQVSNAFNSMTPNNNNNNSSNNNNNSNNSALNTVSPNITPVNSSQKPTQIKHFLGVSSNTKDLKAITKNMKLECLKEEKEDDSEAINDRKGSKENNECDDEEEENENSDIITLRKDEHNHNNSNNEDEDDEEDAVKLDNGFGVEKKLSKAELKLASMFKPKKKKLKRQMMKIRVDSKKYELKHSAKSGEEKYKVNNKLQELIKENQKLISMIKKKDDISLSIPLIRRYYSYMVLEFIRKNFFKFSNLGGHSQNFLDEQQQDEELIKDSIKLFEGTNEIQIYCREKRKLIKKSLFMDKKIHGISVFPSGSRTFYTKDRVYITGGKDCTQEYKIFMYYCIKDNKLYKLNDLNHQRSYHTMVYHENLKSILVFGGENNKTCEMFDFFLGTWSDIPELNLPRANISMFIDKIGTFAYAFCGTTGTITGSQNSDVIELLDLVDMNQGWAKIEYSNKANVDLKFSHTGIYPLTEDKILIYGASDSRRMQKCFVIFNLRTFDVTKVDRELLEELRMNAMKNPELSRIFL